MLDNANGSAPSDIAIVGMALRVPGARSVDEFWHNLRSGTESIRNLSEDELLAAGASPEDIHHPNYVRRAAELPDMEMFDAEFFGFSPKEAAVMDPQHRHFLQCVWEAMEDAGRMSADAAGPIGVFAGCGMGSYFYFNVCSNRALVDQVGMFLLRHTGNDKDFLATRASYTFDLRGPSINIQTACSTSLVAIHYACQSLLNGECDMALAGGVTIEMPHRRGYHYQEGEILSPDGHCRPFDHRAAGTVFGSGVGVVALRRLSDALADGDTIHAVIKATAINNDGATKAGYLAPSVTGQASVIVEALGLGGIGADSIQYVECHGTGTALGDPIEIEALTQAFRQSTDRTGYCAVGSVKSNIGHLDTAAGVVGLIKATLALRHGEIPPTIGYERANPAIQFETSPFFVNGALTAWPQTQDRRRACVNSLGVGGTNAHAILEQAPFRASGERRSTEPVALVLSARNTAALEQSAGRLGRWLTDNPSADIGDVAHTLWSGRKRFEQNRVIAVRSRDDAISALADPKRFSSQTKTEAASGAVFLFAGGGAQHREMAGALYRDNAEFRSVVEEGLSVLPTHAANEIRAAWFGPAPADGPDPLLRPSVQLPAILIVEVAVARLWMRAGIIPAALIGHSMGENAAACIAGVIDFADAVRLVRLRGELFDKIAPGGMLSIPMPEDELRSILPKTLDMASVNAPGLCVVSGTNEDLADFQEVLAARDIGAVRIPIDIAAHSRMLDVMLPQWEAFLRTLKFSPPRFPIVSNLTGDWLTAEQAVDPTYWVRHLRSTVLFAAGMKRLAQDPYRIYVEVGPGKTLSTLTKAQGAISADQVINSLPHPDDASDDALHLLAAMARAAVVGLPVDPSLLCGGGTPRRLNLPTYPFQHRRYFIEVDASSRAKTAEPDLVKEPDLSRWGYRPVWKQSLPDYETGAETQPHTWLIFMDETGIGASLVQRLRRQGHKVVTVSVGDAYARRSAEDHVLCPELGLAGYTSLVQSLVADGLLPDRIVHAWLLTSDDRARAGSNLFHKVQDTGFHSMLHLSQALGEIELPGDVHVTVLTNGMQKVGTEPLPYPEKATVLGPGLVVPRELSGVTVRLIDIETERGGQAKRSWLRRTISKGDATHEGADDMLWEDLFSKPVSEVVAYRGAKRWTRSYARFSLDLVEPERTQVKRGGTYLFAGGLGDIATVIAAELVEKYQARIVLLGRTVLPPRETWRDYRRQRRADATTHGIETILGLERFGGDILYCCADVTDSEAVTAAIQQALERFGRIDGVFHAAGRVDDGLLQQKTSDGIESVLAPKVTGTRVLEQALRAIDVDFLVLFSSTSTITAPAGQVDYVAANAFLDAYAESVAEISGRRTISLHWGIWNEVGLAARATGTARDRRSSLESERPHGPFYQRWARDEAGLACLEADIASDIDWFLDEHRLLSGEAVLPGAAYFEIVAQAAREHGIAHPIELRDLVMLRPLVVRDGERWTLRTTIERSERGWRVTVRANLRDDPSEFERYAEAMLDIDANTSRPRVDLAGLLDRLPKARHAAPGASLPSAQARHIRFGARWEVLRSARFADGEAVGELELRPEHLNDIAGGLLFHPALLDIATGFAMPLAPAFGGSDVLWAPASYGKVRLYGPLPERVVSHVVLASSHEYGPDYAAFDISITDEDGNLILEAERFLMKRLTSDTDFARAPASVAPTRDATGRASAAALKLGLQVRQGILPSEGFEALVRALSSGVRQPIVSSIDLSALCARAAVAAARKEQVSALFQRTDTNTEIIAPRNPVEAMLADCWKELLGLSDVGVHDNFFDLGGHSLMAVRLFRSVKKQYGVDLPISVLFSAPTIAECAELIGAQMPSVDPALPVSHEPAAAAQRFVHLTLMHPGHVAGATPLFICAGMFGNILNLRHLALHLGTDRPVYGLQARGLYGEMKPHESFEEMARDYLAEIRSVQPRGPYLIAGYSGGGITAYEMARQLEESGEIVARIVMLDTPQTTQPPLGFRDRLSMKAQDLRRDGFGYLGRWLEARARWHEEMKRKQDAQGDDVASSETFNNERIELAFRRALGIYEVRPWKGRLTVFRPKPDVRYRLSGGRRLMANRNIVLDDNGWSAHASSLDVIEVPGDHDTMVLEPHVRVLAARMRQILSGGTLVRLADSPEQGCTHAAGVRQPEMAAE